MPRLHVSGNGGLLFLFCVFGGRVVSLLFPEQDELFFPLKSRICSCLIFSKCTRALTFPMAVFFFGAVSTTRSRSAAPPPTSLLLLNSHSNFPDDAQLLYQPRRTLNTPANSPARGRGDNRPVSDNLPHRPGRYDRFVSPQVCLCLCRYTHTYTSTLPNVCVLCVLCVCASVRARAHTHVHTAR